MLPYDDEYAARRMEELLRAKQTGSTCSNCVFWAPNSGRGHSGGVIRDGRGQCLGEEMNRADHTPWTRLESTCDDFRSKLVRHMFKVSFGEIAAVVIARGFREAGERAARLCKKEGSNFNCEIVETEEV